jgi:hypothetical protein
LSGGEGILAGYYALEILVKTAFVTGKKNLDFRASAFSGRVIAIP